MKTKKLKLQLVLDVTYDLNGNRPEDVREELRAQINYQIGNGLLTASLDCWVDEHRFTITEIKPKKST